MAELRVDYSACVVAGTALRDSINATRMYYSELCEEYFDSLLAKPVKPGGGFTESACAFLLLDGLLQKNGVERSGLVISRDPEGRPRIINRTDIDFSISHSEGAAFCCLAVGENASVGADIQRVRNYSREYMEQLARTFMSKSRLESFLICSDRERYFYTAWTEREAVYKRCGVYPGLTAENDGTPAQGITRRGIITACGSRYHYCISLPETAE